MPNDMVDVIVQIAAKDLPRLMEAANQKIATWDTHGGYRKFVDMAFKRISQNSASSATAVNPYLAIGLGTANLAVSATGFAMVMGKLNEMSKQLNAIDKRVDQIKGILDADKIREYNRITLCLHEATQTLLAGEELNLRDTSMLLQDMKTFMTELCNLMVAQSMKTSLCLEMIFNLLSAYTLLLTEYLKAYRFAKGHVYPDPSPYFSIYAELQDRTFVNAVKDHLFLDEGMHARTVLQAAYAQKQRVECELEQVTAQSELLNTVENREEYEHILCGIGESIRQVMQEQVPELATETGTSEAECTTAVETLLQQVGLATA